MDPIIIRIKDRDIFLSKRFFFSTFCFGTCFYLVWDVDVGWDRMSIWARFPQINRLGVTVPYGTALFLSIL